MIPILIMLAILFILGILTHLLSCTTVTGQRWYEEWPAIDDDEFLARCPPGTDREVALKVRKIVAEQTGVAYEHVYPEQNFVNDLDCC